MIDHELDEAVESDDDVAAGTLARQNEVLWLHRLMERALGRVEKSEVRNEEVDQSRRERILWRQTVVGHEAATARQSGERSGCRSGRSGTTCTEAEAGQPWSKERVDAPTRGAHLSH
jgi:hypothetical protein